MSTNVRYQVQLGKPWHRAVFLISKYASLWLWDATAASTPHGGTVGMHCLLPASLFHVTFPPNWNNVYKRQENAEQRELESVRNIWLFFGVGGRTNPFIRKSSRALPVPGTCAVLSSCVSRDPFCYREQAKCLSHHLLPRELWRALACLHSW